MKQKVFHLLLIILVMLCSVPDAYAHKNDQHYKEIESVLFGTKSATILTNSDKKKLVRHLEYAASLALDQFNGNNATLLTDLQQFSVEKLPKNVTDLRVAGGINFTASGNTHRQYTHRGWTYEYKNPYTDANWPLRKNIMINTVKKVLNSQNEVLCESFAAILYYIHVLGDVQSDSVRSERDQVIPLIEKHGMGDLLSYKPNKDIFIELYHYLSMLYEQSNISKTYRSYYNRMMSKIKKIYSNAKADMKNNSAAEKKANDNNLTPSQLDKYANELIHAISDNLPLLLEHSIFKGVFYS